MKGRRGGEFWVGMALGVALVAGWLAMVAYNAAPYFQGATPPPLSALLSQIVTPPALASVMAPNLAALAGWALAVVIVALAVTLVVSAGRIGERRDPIRPTGHLPLVGEGPWGEGLMGREGGLAKEGDGSAAMSGGARVSPPAQDALPLMSPPDVRAPLPTPLTPESAPPPAFSTYVSPVVAPEATPAPVVTPEIVAPSGGQPTPTGAPVAPPPDIRPPLQAPMTPDGASAASDAQLQPVLTAAPGAPAALVSTAPAASAAASAPVVAAAPDSAAESGAPFEPWVFISHSSMDDDFGQRLTADLRAALAPGAPGRKRVWYDQAPERGVEEAPGAVAQPGGLTAGTDYPTEIAVQIASRNAVVVILSPEAARSRWVRYELSQSVRRFNSAERGGIYPIILRTCVTPEIIGNLQTLDFRIAPAGSDAYQKLLVELVARVSSGRALVSESGPPMEVALLIAPPRLIGRDDDLRWVLERLRAGGATGITALRGLGGIGKSALAAVAIRLLAEEGAFPDGIAVVSCENKADPVEILRDTLSRFTPGRRPPDADAIAGLTTIAQGLLAGKRALITLDNIEPGWPVEIVTAALAATGVTLLLTARQTLPAAAVPGNGVRRLELLDAEHALAVFTQTYGGPDTIPADLSEEERAAAWRIVTAVDRHTLAVRLAGIQAAARVENIPQGQRGATLAAVATGIERDMLGIPEDDTPRKVEKVLSLSVDALPPDGLRLFVALAGFATGEFGRQAAIALARGLGLAIPEDSVDLLIRRALLDTSYEAALAAHAGADAERLRLHPLLRALATTLLDAWPMDAQAAVERAIGAWYGDYMPPVINSSQIGYLALIPDEANITGALDWALDHHDDRAAANLCGGMGRFWRDTGRTGAGLHYLPLGAAAAGRVAVQSGARRPATAGEYHAVSRRHAEDGWASRRGPVHLYRGPHAAARHR